MDLELSNGFWNLLIPLTNFEAPAPPLLLAPTLIPTPNLLRGAREPGAAAHAHGVVSVR